MCCYTCVCALDALAPDETCLPRRPHKVRQGGKRDGVVVIPGMACMSWGVRWGGRLLALKEPEVVSSSLCMELASFPGKG